MTRGRALISIGLALSGLAGPAVADEEGGSSISIQDAECDVVARRTDPGGDGPFDPAVHRLIDLHKIRLGAWTPSDPADDLFDGGFSSSGKFVRIDLILDGLVNPPGPTTPSQFQPFLYGDHPVYGFVEIDVDDDEQTGGELAAPQYRYLGNIVRFGGIPEGDEFNHRVAKDASAFDGDFNSRPNVERHGEEFHLALLGSLFGSSDITEVAGNGDLVFEAGEKWVIHAAWFHRAHGFEPFSFAIGGAVPGEYMPAGDLQFLHKAANDETIVSLVFPLTNEGAGLIRGEPAEPNNADPSDQASVLEGLDDLYLSATFLAMFPTGLPEEQIIIDWQNHYPDEHLDPTRWRPTALLGTSYTAPEPSGEFFVWTDAHPDPIRGNVNGENGAGNDDRSEIQDYIKDYDASDGTVDGVVVLAGFATDFSVYDVNHDGQVDYIDELLVSAPGDCDDDGDVDLADLGSYQVCFTGIDVGYADPLCALADLDADNDVDLKDFKWMEDVVTGAVPAGSSLCVVGGECWNLIR